jgi:hypothetical protein
MKNRWGILSATLAAVFVLGSALPSPALANAGCQQRIARAQHRLEKAIRKHGYQSPQAERRRQQLAEARASCR